MTDAFHFHPAVAAWFGAHFPGPTDAQAEAWPSLQAGRNVLVAAPTGSGKTLAAFLAAIDGLVRQGVNAPLRLAAEGALQRHPQEPRCAPRGHPAGVA